MSPDREQEIHHNHLEWISENGLHRDETRIWQYDLYQLMPELAVLTTALHCHEVALADHAAAIRDHGDKLKAEEHILAVSHQALLCEDLPTLTERVRLEEATHSTIADRHEAIKQHHFEILKHWNALMHALRACECRPPQ